jgi:tRNA(Ile)-lysidine synthase TilS/MesJ
MYEFRSIVTKAGKACHNFSMLSENDRILICFSGGKDSYAMLKVLEQLKRKYPINFELKVLCVNPNFDSKFEKNIRSILEKENFEFEIINSQIKEVVEKQDTIKKMRPCFMCSRLRRGIIYDYAIKNGYNKIALGHNLDDAIETHLMNLFYGSKLSLLKPKYLADNAKIEVIRPLIYVDEDIIVKYVKKVEFVAVKDECPLKEDDSKRDYFKNLLKELKRDNPRIKECAYNAFHNIKELNDWKR